MKEGKTCTICGKTFTRRNYMQKHMEHIHSKRYSCPKCFRYFSGPTEHSCAVENGRFVCYVRNCSLKFSNGMAMRLHIRDCHRKMDEEAVEENIKTKKGIRQLIQNLCKKINLLSNCFDELKYQVDTIGDFLQKSDLGYEVDQINSISTTRKRKLSYDMNAKDVEEEEEDETIEYIEDIESIEELSDENEETTIDEIIYENESKIDEESKNVPTIVSNISIQPVETNPIAEVVPVKNRSVLLNQSFLNSTSTTILNTQNLQLSPLILKHPVRIIPIKPVTKVGSTIITQIPAVRLQSQPKKISIVPSSAASNSQIISQPKTIAQQITATSTTTSNSSPTPPLFLNIEYDTQTNVSENDRKITFHFDTKPPEENKAKPSAKINIVSKRAKLRRQ